MTDIVQIEMLTAEISWYIWVVMVFAIFIIFGDRGLWDYEVKFPYVEGVGRGKVEFECYKKRGSMIEIRLELESGYNHEEITIMLNGESVYTIPSQKNTGSRVYVNEKAEYEKPNEGDEVIVQIGNQSVFVGQLVLD